MDTKDSAKIPYEAPSIKTMDASEILETLGPAQGLGSGVSGTPGAGPGGLDEFVNPGSPRHLGRR